MKIFSSGYSNELTAKYLDNPRKRQHGNIHESYEDPYQRFLNALNPGSYIRPHKPPLSR